MSNTTTSNQKQVVLAGNPNVGKSVFFHYLSSIYVDVSNYPGTTVEITSAKLSDHFTLKDTPGIYGVSSFNDEERVARDVILYADEVLNIVSAISLERDLFLTKQLIDMGKPLIIVINQIDEAKAIGLEINIQKLSDELGVPIFETIAITGEGMEKVKEAILTEGKAITGKIDPVLQRELTELLPIVSNQAEALLLLEGDLIIAERHKVEPRNIRNEIYSQRRKEVNNLISSCVTKKGNKERFLTKVSNILISPLWGSLIAMFIGYLFLYQFLGIWVGGDLINITEKKVMNAYYEPFVRETIGSFLPVEVILNEEKKSFQYTFPNGFLNEREKYNSLKETIKQNANLKKDYFFGPSDFIEARASSKSTITKLPHNFLSSLGTILAGKYGMLTLTVTYLLGLLLPLVIAFYTALAVLEDSGYLPRLAVLMDGMLSRIGMNGRAIIPLILGLGCVTMAAVTTRLLNTKREKLIAMTVLGFAIPCSAQLGVIQTLLAKNGGIKGWLIWIITLGIILMLTGHVMNKFLPGKTSSLLIDLPPLRLPRIKNIFHKTKTKVGFFMSEAVPAFFLAAFIVALMQIAGILDKVISLFKPISRDLLHLPEEVSVSFILGMVRRDFGAFGLTEIPMTGTQVTVASIVLTLFVPCIATVSVMAKEQSWKVALGIWISSMVLAIATGSLVYRILGA